MEVATPESLAVALLDAASLSFFGRLHGEVPLDLVPVRIFIATR